MPEKKKNNNPFTMRDEIILIEYEDVIKCPSAGILELIKRQYEDDLKGLIDLDKINNMDFKNIQRFCIERPCKNILDYIKLQNFNTDKIYKALYDAFDTIYMELPTMVMGNAVYVLSPQKFTKKIYIFSEEYDEKIEYDIKEKYYTEKNVFYVAGKFDDILDTIEQPTSFILSDIDKVETIINKKKQKFTEILIAQYGYNYEVIDGILQIKGEYDTKMADGLFKIASFTPLTMDKSYYTN